MRNLDVREWFGRAESEPDKVHRVDVAALGLALSQVAVYVGVGSRWRSECLDINSCAVGQAQGVHAVAGAVYEPGILRHTLCGKRLGQSQNFRVGRVDDDVDAHCGYSELKRLM